MYLSIDQLVFKKSAKKWAESLLWDNMKRQMTYHFLKHLLLEALIQV